jgi:predicted permease
MNAQAQTAVTICIIALSMLAGYLARRWGWLREESARPMMTSVVLFGYPSLGGLAIWGTHLLPSDIWLPTLGFVQTVGMAILALLIGRGLFRDVLDRGVLGLCCAVGNHGITMVGFVVYLLYGQEGLGHSTIYGMYSYFGLVLVCYPIAKHYSPDGIQRSLVRLLLSSIFDVRSVGLVALLGAIGLSAFGVPRPAVIDRLYIVDILLYAIIIAAYVSVGLRLHLGHMLRLWRTILAMLAVRHVAGPVIAVALLALTRLTAWPLEGLNRDIFIIQSSVPVAIVAAASANMFHVKPRETSMVCVVSSLIYLGLGVPIVCWLFG